MAERIVSVSVESILGFLATQAIKEIQWAYGVKDELGKLKDTVEIISEGLEDAEKQFDDKYQSIFRRLKDVVYDGEDLLDYFYTKLKLKEMKSGNKIVKEVRIFFSTSNQIAFSFKMGRKIEDIRKRLDAIKYDEEFILFKKDNGNGENYYNRSERGQTHSFVLEENVIGREKDKNAIIQLLLDSNNHEENVSVISIVGIAGIGKTTLVQSIYSDERVKNHFQLCMWVCVSHDFTLKTMVKKILKSGVNGKEIRSLDMDGLREKLHEQIDRKKYLLILDDVWNDNCERWLKLENLLQKCVKGSKILVTTRSEKVANIMSSPQFIYHLTGLPLDKSWSIFKKSAFQKGNEPKDSEVIRIGKKIVAKCGGVPLAIKTIGSKLLCKNQEKEWRRMEENELSEIAQEQGDILPELKVSYDRLSPQLKQCFAYCALFPKDNEFDKMNLIQLWMSQGFLGTSNKNQGLEDVGNDYFENLVLGKFLKVLKEEKDEYGAKFIVCKMNNLMHDLARYVAKSECKMVTRYADDVDKRIRHISFDHNIKSLQISPAMFKANRLRTFLPLCGYIELDKFYLKKIISNLRYLRTLNISGLQIKKVSNSIKKLRHLRYLNLSWNSNLRELPDSMWKLINLQTLDLSHCKSLMKIPRSMRKMVNLRYLMIEGCKSLTSMPDELKQFIGLQTLPLSVVGERGRKNEFYVTEEDLEEKQHLLQDYRFQK